MKTKPTYIYVFLFSTAWGGEDVDSLQLGRCHHQLPNNRCFHRVGSLTFLTVERPGGGCPSEGTVGSSQGLGGSQRHSHITEETLKVQGSEYVGLWQIVSPVQVRFKQCKRLPFRVYTSRDLIPSVEFYCPEMQKCPRSRARSELECQ